ncbi:hypothetical protein N7448_004728 [Penicillium atrosanguineum]|uniref:Uncharacterized protein n=1 Tax=Penicillium atrosanguineum TaxID=1132637 RepID=A0A9W9PSY0_9EURO|nr:Autophagy-related protein 9 [Penicillium atrosanguineum]KAJ5125407.1 hypothetical protein N7526_007584 [Penicillium atrosanguineum]KAJ5136174.1 hypothetical protein N7448_004728 [Penicillium atrosanguineum]KAJ5292524.1 Autophagy-related protein 9 [Penicillium atrosanguineum]KAJ5303453.1 hypothetical protein N7476_010252 [Penicillium atrosanguineum]
MHLTSTALVASSLLLASSAAAKAFNFENHLDRRAGATLVGCYSSSEGMGNQTSYTFQSSGWCYDRCSGSPYNAAAFALTAGSDCLCGDELPLASDKVSSGKCNKACDGWPEDMCGGSGFFSVYTTGLVSDVPSYSDSTTTSSSSSETNTATTKSSGATASVSTDANGATTVVTATSAPKPSSTDDIEAEKKSTHNTAAIAAGVVVGVVGLAALAGAVWFFYRSKKQKAEGFRGTSGGFERESPPSMTDSRFDGGYMAQRRQSNGSIDDDHDFSRRILQVTNPDAGRYH